MVVGLVGEQVVLISIHVTWVCFEQRRPFAGTECSVISVRLSNTDFLSHQGPLIRRIL